MTNVSGPKPTESLFYAPIVYLIGKLSGFKAYVGVDHAVIQDDALRLTGIDPENCLWPLESESSKHRDGLYRTIHLAWYHQTRRYRTGSSGLCCRPNDPRTRGKPGFWALTHLGVKKAKALREIYEGKITLSAGPNQTAQFLGDNWDKLYERAQLALRRKMPRSETLNKVDDHIMNWAEKVIQRDGLRSRLELGKSLAPSQISGWIRKAAYTEIRNEGREPVCRVFHGALTPKEILSFKDNNWIEEVIPRTINETDILSNNPYAAHSEDDDTVSDITENLQDTHPSARVEETLAGADAFNFCMDRVSKILMEEIAEEYDPAFHCQLVHDRFVKEMTVREIAEHHGLNFNTEENRIKVALSRVRDVMLQHRSKGVFDEFMTR